MITGFVKEQKRYTRDELRTILSSTEKACSESDLIRIIKRLKCYGVLKCVKWNELQLNLTDLAEEDIEVVDEDSIQGRYFYVFSFVGIIIIESRILKCYPKYIKMNKSPTRELRQVINVLRKYDSAKQTVRMYNYEGYSSNFNRLSVIMFLLQDYYDNGVYTNEEDSIEVNGMGEINWDNTINSTFPVIIDNKPYYFELKTMRRVKDSENYFKRLHECILTMCVNELKRCDLISLLDLEEICLSNEILENFGDDEYIVQSIENELGIQFNTRKQTVLKALQSIIINKGTLDDENSFSLFGTNKFNLVWQKVCEEVFDNRLYTQLKNLGLKTIVIPEGALYNVDSKLIDIIEKPQWCGISNNKEFSKTALKTLVPDLVSIYKQEKELFFVIFDAKYYSIQLEADKTLCGQPGVSDITKQYLYQLSFKEFFKFNGINRVMNCFLMPTENKAGNMLIEKGFVKMDMLHGLGLQNIRVILLCASVVYSYYLSNRTLCSEIPKMFV